MLPNPKIEKKKSGNGGGYLSQRCAGGRGNTTHTPEAVGDRLQSPDSLGKERNIFIKLTEKHFTHHNTQ